MAVQEGVLYQAAGSAWPLSDIEIINNRIAQMIKRALKLPPSYPYALIHGTVGGLGLKSFSQLHQEHIERILKRCIAGPEPGASAARGLVNRAFRTLDNEDTGLGKGAAVAQQSPVDTYIKALLVQGDKAGEKLHRKGDSQRPYLEHIATKIHEMYRPMYKWVQAWDIQYATEVIDWGRGTERDRPLLSWLDTGGNDDIKATLLAGSSRRRAGHRDP
jgi:hypothetical protein